MSRNPLFDDSYHRLFGHSVTISAEATPFFATFYERFLRDDDIRGLFATTNMVRQRAMLRKSLFQLVAYYVSHEPTNELQRIARVHAKIGVTNEHYDLWLDALVATVAEHDPECDMATELAWRWAMTPGITYMRLISHLPEH